MDHADFNLEATRGVLRGYRILPEGFNNVNQLVAGNHISQAYADLHGHTFVQHGAMRQVLEQTPYAFDTEDEAHDNYDEVRMHDLTAHDLSQENADNLHLNNTRLYPRQWYIDRFGYVPENPRIQRRHPTEEPSAKRFKKNHPPPPPPPSSAILVGGNGINGTKNKWLLFVKHIQNKHKCSYKEALQIASKQYKK